MGNGERDILVALLVLLMKSCNQVRVVERSEVQIGNLSPTRETYRPSHTFIGDEGPACRTALVVALQNRSELIRSLSAPISSIAPLHPYFRRCSCTVGKEGILNNVPSGRQGTWDVLSRSFARDKGHFRRGLHDEGAYTTARTGYELLILSLEMLSRPRFGGGWVKSGWTQQTRRGRHKRALRVRVIRFALPQPTVTVP